MQKTSSRRDEKKSFVESSTSSNNNVQAGVTGNFALSKRKTNNVNAANKNINMQKKSNNAIDNLANLYIGSNGEGAYTNKKQQRQLQRSNVYNSNTNSQATPNSEASRREMLNHEPIHVNREPSTTKLHIDYRVAETFLHPRGVDILTVGILLVVLVSGCACMWYKLAIRAKERLEEVTPPEELARVARLVEEVAQQRARLVPHAGNTPLATNIAAKHQSSTYRIQGEETDSEPEQQEAAEVDGVRNAWATPVRPVHPDSYV
eukprot:g10033.t1